METLHLDSSSFHVHGEYKSENRDLQTESVGIEITHGYSRDHRPDLKQFIVDLMCSGDGDIPLYLRVADGNEADQAAFAQIVRQFKQQWQLEALFVADAALYSEENLQQLKNLRWLSRVPATLSTAKLLLAQMSEAAFADSEIERYRIAECCSDYGAIKQRWLVVESQERKQADLGQLEKRLALTVAQGSSRTATAI